jgi:hypothetical protein
MIVEENGVGKSNYCTHLDWFSIPTYPTAPGG